MQRKKSNNRNGRLANSAEKAFQGWLKEQPCVWCHKEGPSIVDHCRGQTWSHNKVHAGHWFCISQCVECDTQKTIHGKRQGNESKAWTDQMYDYSEHSDAAPDDVIDAIVEWNQ